MSEEDPQNWSAFFSEKMAGLEKILQTHRDNRLRASLTPEKRVIEMRAEVARGRRVRNFIDGEFWKEDLEPFLRGEAKLKPWALGDPLKMEEVSTLHLYNSGKVFILSSMLKQFGKWIEAGEASAKVLAAEEEKRRTLHSK